ncbi:MAG: cobalamin-dependent protein [Deltaproteobacteria bacterium]|jgi:methanogenic corrinoid protein MtbC1|nr:cobalamin-dependent protein [Deltaproteobacteria bacterium]
MNDHTPSLERLTHLFVSLRDTACRRVARELLAMGTDPADIIDVCQRSLSEIGYKFQSGEYFISALIMGGDIMQRIMDMALPYSKTPRGAPGRGKVLIGTVAGDIHELGKNLAGSLLTAHGYEVRDLGVDVRPERFLEETWSFRPHILGLSSLMTSGHGPLSQTVQLIRRQLPDDARPIIILSGSMVAEVVKTRSGADYVVTNVSETVVLCESIMTKKNRP